jgi:hypothetical protein
MKRTISKDTPLAEITLRKYEKPSVKGRELVRKLCLSLGLLQPGDSRDVVVDVLMVMLKHKDEELTSQQVEELTIKNREEHNVPVLGVAPSNIRRQLLRLRDLMLVEKTANNYRINESATLQELLSEKIESYLLKSTLVRVREYVRAVDEEFNR